MRDYKKRMLPVYALLFAIFGCIELTKKNYDEMFMLFLASIGFGLVAYFIFKKKNRED